MTIVELQRAGIAGDESAIRELGIRCLDIDFCFGDDHYCAHQNELSELHDELAREIPPDCPRCGFWLTEI